MKHPLINKESTHYHQGKESTIYKIEEQLTMQEMIGACKFNILKYKDRTKGQDEKDEVKILTYTKYLAFLHAIIEEYQEDVDDIGEMRVRAVLDFLLPNLAY